MNKSYIYKIIYETDSGVHYMYYDNVNEIYNLVKPCIKRIERIKEGKEEIVKLYDSRDNGNIGSVYLKIINNEEKILIRSLYNLSRL